MEGLRGLLALQVFAQHLVGISGVAFAVLPRPLQFFADGGAAVDVFIVLSGFVIFMLLDQGREPYLAFLWRRFFRLFPAYGICLALGVLLSFHASEILSHLPWQTDVIVAIREHWEITRAHFWPNLAWHLALLHGLWPNEILPFSVGGFLEQAWSVSLEWQFYLIAPLVWMLVSKRSRWLLPILLVAALGPYLEAHTGDYLRNGRHLSYPLKGFLPLEGHYFLVGILSYYLFSYCRARRWKPPAAPYLPAVVVAWIFLPTPLCVWTLVFAACLYPTGHDTPLLAKTVSAVTTFRPISFLGRVSYSVYLLHYPVIYGGAWLILHFGGISNQGRFLVVLTAISVPITLIGSAAMFHWVEAPAMQWAKRTSRSLFPVTARS